MEFLPYSLWAVLVNIPAVIIWWVGLPYYICAFAGPGISLLLYLTILHVRKDDAYIMLRDTAWNSAPLQKLRARFSS